MFLFLETDDVDRDDSRYRAFGIEFVREPKTEYYRTVAVFKGLYGNGGTSLSAARSITPESSLLQSRKRQTR
jgi:hypothetical protein